MASGQNENGIQSSILYTQEQGMSCSLSLILLAEKCECPLKCFQSVVGASSISRSVKFHIPFNMPFKVAPSFCKIQVHVLPLNVFMQVYVPENLWISSSATCGMKLQSE